MTNTLRIKELLNEKHLSSGDLAKRMGIPRQYIYQVCNGRVNPTLTTLKKIADALEVRIIDLFSDSKNDALKPKSLTVTCPVCNCKIEIS